MLAALHTDSKNVVANMQEAKRAKGWMYLSTEHDKNCSWWSSPRHLAGLPDVEATRCTCTSAAPSETYLCAVAEPWEDTCRISH